MRASLSFAGRRTCKLCRTSRLNGFTAVLAGSVSGFLACCFTGITFDPGFSLYGLFFFFSILVFHSEDLSKCISFCVNSKEKKNNYIYFLYNRSCAFAPPTIHRGEIMNGEGGKN